MIENHYTVMKTKVLTNSHKALGKQGTFFILLHFIVLGEGKEKLVELP